MKEVCTANGKIDDWNLSGDLKKTKEEEEKNQHQ